MPHEWILVWQNHDSHRFIDRKTRISNVEAEEKSVSVVESKEKACDLRGTPRIHTHSRRIARSRSRARRREGRHRRDVRAHAHLRRCARDSSLTRVLTRKTVAREREREREREKERERGKRRVKTETFHRRPATCPMRIILSVYFVSVVTYFLRKGGELLSLTYLSRGSIHVVFRVLWSMKYTFPSKSWATSHPSGSGISPFRLLGIFHYALNPSKTSLSIVVRSTGAYLCARTHASRAAYTARSHDGRDVRERDRTRQVDGEEWRRRRKGREETRDGEDGRPGRRRAGGRREGREGVRARRWTATVPVVWRGRIKTYCNTHGTQEERRDQERTLAYVYARTLSLFLFLSGSRALLRHHEYLIIMSGVTSESPPSDSSRAEFHR